MKKENIALKILNHPEKDEIISKLCMNISPADINEWLVSRYDEINEASLIVSEKALYKFKNDYLDFYNTMMEDVEKVKNEQLSTTNQLSQELNGNITYQNALTKYANEEVDIRSLIKRVAAAVEARSSYVFDLIASDPENTKLDETLIQWFSLLANIAEKFENIQTGNQNAQTINNNINVQIIDGQISQVYGIIKDILQNLDHATSMKFVDELNNRMNALKEISEDISEPLPIDVRMSQIKSIDASISSKLEK